MANTALARQTATQVFQRAQEIQAALQVHQPIKHLVSAPALHAARTLLQNFDVHEKRNVDAGFSVPVNEYNLAVLIDICTCIFRLEPFRKQAGSMAAKVADGTASRDEVVKFLTELSVAFNWMPQY